MSQKLVHHPTVAARLARLPTVKRAPLLAALRCSDPAALAVATGLYQMLRCSGALPRDVTLEAWICDRIFEAAQSLAENLIGGVYQDKTVQEQPDFMVVAGRVRSFHFVT